MSATSCLVGNQALAYEAADAVDESGKRIRVADHGGRTDVAGAAPARTVDDRRSVGSDTRRAVDIISPGAAPLHPHSGRPSARRLTSAPWRCAIMCSATVRRTRWCCAQVRRDGRSGQFRLICAFYDVSMVLSSGDAGAAGECRAPQFLAKGRMSIRLRNAVVSFRRRRRPRPARVLAGIGAPRRRSAGGRGGCPCRGRARGAPDRAAASPHRSTIASPDAVLNVYSIELDDGTRGAAQGRRRGRPRGRAPGSRSAGAATARRSSSARCASWRRRRSAQPIEQKAGPLVGSCEGKLALLHADRFDEGRSEFIFELHDAIRRADHAQVPRGSRSIARRDAGRGQRARGGRWRGRRAGDRDDPGAAAAEPRCRRTWRRRRRPTTCWSS